MNEIKIVIFQLNEEVCATNTLEIQEILKYDGIIEVDDSPDYLCGLYDYRGTNIPIINLNKKFNIGELNVNKKTKIIVSIIKKQWIGFAVNDVLEITNIMENEIDNVPDVLYKKRKDYVSKIAKKDDKLIVILNISEILSKNEYNKVIEIRDRNLIKN